MKLEDLKAELTSNSILKVINKHILGGSTICFGGDLDLIMELKKRIVRPFQRTYEKY